MQLFTKTYANDLPWFRMAAISVLKKCQDPIHWTVCIEEAALAKLADVIEEVTKRTGVEMAFTMISRESLAPDTAGMDGYLAQQWIKMNIHRLPWNGDKVWMWDSDVIALRSFAEQDFMGLRLPTYCRPMYFFTPYNSIMCDEYRNIFNIRIETMKQIFGVREVPFEWMRCFPICVIPEILRCASERYEWRSLLVRFRAGDRTVSEFNVYGQLASMYFPDAYEWWSTQNRETWQGPFDNPAKITCQSWSYGGVPNVLRDFVEKM